MSDKETNTQDDDDGETAAAVAANHSAAAAGESHVDFLVCVAERDGSRSRSLCTKIQRFHRCGEDPLLSTNACHYYHYFSFYDNQDNEDDDVGGSEQSTATSLC